MLNRLTFDIGFDPSVWVMTTARWGLKIKVIGEGQQFSPKPFGCMKRRFQAYRAKCDNSSCDRAGQACGVAGQPTGTCRSSSR